MATSQARQPAPWDESLLDAVEEILEETEAADAGGAGAEGSA